MYRFDHVWHGPFGAHRACQTYLVHGQFHCTVRGVKDDHFIEQPSITLCRNIFIQNSSSY